MTVAALDVTPPYPQEWYSSSEGPANGFGSTAAGDAVNPNIAAFANVSTASYPDARPTNSTAPPRPRRMLPVRPPW